MTVVVDASVAADLVTGDPAARRRVHERLQPHASDLHAPHLLTAEVGHVVRRHVLRGAMTAARGAMALRDLADMPLQLYPHGLLLQRALELHANASFYDALYLALAELLDAPLLTRDARLVGVPGTRAQVEVIRGELPR